jgi:hypothetical protein
MQAAQAVDIREVEQRIAELSKLSQIDLKLEKSKVFQHYHVFMRDSDGTFTGWITRPLNETLYIINVCIALEQEKKAHTEGTRDATI